MDTSFAMYEDMRSHTGAILTLGKGALTSLSCKQKINTKSSTEAELVGVDDAINFLMWVNLFITEEVAKVLEASVIKVMGNNAIVQ